MTDRGVDLSVLSPNDRKIVRHFAAALRQVREEETELLRLSTLYRLELWRDGLAELYAELELRAGAVGVDSRRGECAHPRVDRQSSLKC
jgi:hypothetical protein